MLKYVLMTPARNEEAFIEEVIRSVVSQSQTPEKWIIISDGSTDRTDEIVKKWSEQYPWIQLLRMPERRERHFGGKAHGLNTGYALLKDVHFDLVGCLDSDLTFDSDYFSFLLQKFSENSRLGVAGTPFMENGRLFYDYRYMSLDHVSGACQVFRRQCFEQIGGFTPVKAGVDLIAVISARMHGWETRSFLEKVAVHHRKMGTAKHNPLSVKLNVGRQDYSMGADPFWELFRGTYQMLKKPYVIGGLMLLWGYYTSLLKGDPRPVSSAFIAFRRREQLTRLRRLVRKPFDFLAIRPGKGAVEC
ncbi:MAG TPA: glycosyltransferase family 2 protein [Verrucomicrobiae bacterium]